MENQIEWQDRFNIGVEIIDKEHKKLFGVLNKLFAYGKEDEKSQWVCQEAIKYFRDHALKHFAEEEAYMRMVNYPDRDAHKRLHDNFRDKTIPALESELIRTKYSPESVEHFLGVCAGWLIGHTLVEDHAITGKATSKWSGLLPDEMQTAMKNVLVQLLYDTFRIKPRVLSDCYGGEKFGDGIYYRLVYSTDKKERWEVIFIFEEKVLINTMGGLMEAKAKGMDTLLMNAARYTTRDFVENIRHHFARGDSYKMVDEQLLTYEQFYTIFEKQIPQISLLFDTGVGYFAYCVIAPHMFQKEEGTHLSEENAVFEIQEYIAHNHVSRKHKLLVVDDSDFVLHAMERLLGEDYDVMPAKSGMAAIRAITLNRPDLVLLDYEMPVCDGSQVLEMIRSEVDFADIPVIFLTGRTDRESIKKVLALKPAGYLSKSLQPADVKREIDNYFEKRKKFEN